MLSLNREDQDFGSAWRPAAAPAPERSPGANRLGKLLRVGAVLGLAALLAAGPLACQCAEPQYDEEATKEEKPKYEW